MEIVDLHEHLACPNYDHSARTFIEVVKLTKGTNRNLSATNNEIVFIVEGRVRYYFKKLATYEAIKGQIIFRPAGADYAYEILADTTVVIFRISRPILLCDTFPVERLYKTKENGLSVPPTNNPQKRCRLGTLEMNSKVWYLLGGIIDCVEDGLKCRCWSELKIKEFFTLLRVYYTKEELRDSLMLILSEDAAFSDYVRRNWLHLHSVQEMAGSLCLSRKQFTARFVKVFGENPSCWMANLRAQKVLAEIKSTEKPFKQIATENAFSDDTQFTRFCHKQFGHTPSHIRSQSSKK